MELRMFQGIKCAACDGFLHAHEPECPQGKLTAFAQEAAMRERRCPKCHGRVAINRDDFFECRSCRTLFSAGPACGEDADTLEHVFLFDIAMENATRAVVLTTKGKGKFRDDAIIAALRREVVRRRKRQ
jgi:hypothetical protein